MWIVMKLECHHGNLSTAAIDNSSANRKNASTYVQQLQNKWNYVRARGAHTHTHTHTHTHRSPTNPAVANAIQVVIRSSDRPSRSQTPRLSADGVDFTAALNRPRVTALSWFSLPAPLILGLFFRFLYRRPRQSPARRTGRSKRAQLPLCRAAAPPAAPSRKRASKPPHHHHHHHHHHLPKKDQQDGCSWIAELIQSSGATPPIPRVGSQLICRLPPPLHSSSNHHPLLRSNQKPSRRRREEEKKPVTLVTKRPLRTAGHQATAMETSGMWQWNFNWWRYEERSTPTVAAARAFSKRHAKGRNRFH